MAVGGASAVGGAGGGGSGFICVSVLQAFVTGQRRKVNARANTGAVRAPAPDHTARHNWHSDRCLAQGYGQAASDKHGSGLTRDEPTKDSQRPKGPTTATG